jgi:hypothetical protein
MAPGSAVVVTERGATIVILRAFEADRLTESVTFAVKSNAPAVVGVPEIAPLPDSVNPEGSDPLATDHVKGGVPAVAARVWLYAVPAVPVGNDPVVMLGGIGAGLMVMRSARESDSAVASVTRTVKSYGPAVVGVPEMAPLEASVSPGGNDPLVTAHTNGGEVFAVSVCEYAVPAVPAGNEVVVMLGGVAAATIAIWNARVADRFAESVTLAVKVNVPAVVGVPEIAPLPARVRPGGSDPSASDHV